jgi:ATP-dependent RNA helicase RhlE
VHRVGRTGRGFNKGVAISFCSKEEKERLEEIRQFLNKDIEKMKIGKKEYAYTINPLKGKNRVQALIADHESFLKKKRQKKGRKANKKNKLK